MGTDEQGKEETELERFDFVDPDSVVSGSGAPHEPPLDLRDTRLFYYPRKGTRGLTY